MDNEFGNIFEEEKPNENIEVLETFEEPPKNEEKIKEKKKFSFDLKKDKILAIQLVLIVIWVILTVMVYFFGYPLFEPFINV